LKENVLRHERILLETIYFNFTVDHPYKHLLNHVKSVQGTNDLAQVAWNFVNDSLNTTLCLKHPPPLIALAALYLASEFLDIKKTLPIIQNELFNTKIELLEEICNQILDLYESSPNSASNGSFSLKIQEKIIGSNWPLPPNSCSSSANPPSSSRSLPDAHSSISPNTTHHKTENHIKRDSHSSDSNRHHPPSHSSSQNVSNQLPPNSSAKSDMNGNGHHFSKSSSAPSSTSHSSHSSHPSSETLHHKTFNGHHHAPHQPSFEGEGANSLGLRPKDGMTGPLHVSPKKLSSRRYQPYSASG